MPCRVVVGCSESVVVLFFSLFLFFSTMRSFFFLSLVYWPFRTRLLACLIRAAILHFSFRLHLFTSRCFVGTISDLLYQSAAFVFPDGSRVSELVMVSLAFHLFVVGTVIFFLCALMALTEFVLSFVADSSL